MCWQTSLVKVWSAAHKFHSLSSLFHLFCPPVSVSVVFVRYDSISVILKPSSDPGVTDYSRYAGTGEITVNSQVVAAAIKPADVYQLDHVTFTLRHNEVKNEQCADASCIVISALSYVAILLKCTPEESTCA